MAHLPIALHEGMRIGQDLVLQNELAGLLPVRRPQFGSKYQGQSEPTASAFHRDFANGRGAGEASAEPEPAEENRR